MHPYVAGKLGISTPAQDSLENSLHQIHSTNRLLNSIENKLTDFFHKDPQSTTTPKDAYGLGTRDMNINRSRISGQFERDEKVPNLAIKIGSPEDKDFYEYLSPSEELRQQKSNLNFDRNSLLQGRVRPFNPADHILSSGKSYRSPNEKTGHRTGTLKDDVRRSSDIYNSNYHFANRGLSKRDLNVERSRYDQVEDLLNGSENLKGSSNITIDGEKARMSGHTLLEKMNKVEESYQSKVRILEERLYQTESEISLLKRTNMDLETELSRLHTDAGEYRNILARERGKSFEEGKEESAKKAIKHKRKAEESRLENEQLKKDLEELKKRYRQAIEEKENAKTQYDDLLKIHNQMIELDMQKNEKSLRDSSTMALFKRYDADGDMYGRGRDDYEGEGYRGILDQGNSYKQELEYLRENNNLTQKQASYEMQRLKDELKRQKDENDRLGNKLREEKEKAQKIRLQVISETEQKIDLGERSARSERKGRRYNDVGENHTLKAEKGGLKKHTKNKKLSSSRVEGRYNEQSRRNQVLYDELRALGETSKEGCEKLNEVFTEVFEGTRQTYVSPIPYQDDYAGDYDSLEREDRGNESNIERRDRLRRKLSRDLDDIQGPQTGLRVKELVNRRSRSRSRSVRFSPEVKLESRNSERNKEQTQSNRNKGEFEKLTRLKEMVNQKANLKKIKERKSNKSEGQEGTPGKISFEKFKANVQEKTKLKAKGKGEKEKRRGKISKL